MNRLKYLWFYLSDEMKSILIAFAVVIFALIFWIGVIVSFKIAIDHTIKIQTDAIVQDVDNKDIHP